MEALTDDIVFSLSAFLRPRDLTNLALTSRRFGGVPVVPRVVHASLALYDAEIRAAKRRRHNYFRGGAKNGGDSGSVSSGPAFSLSAFLRPRDLAHWALTSLGFGGNGAEASAAAGAKRRRPGRKCSLMEEAARRLVVEQKKYSFELLQRQGDESWMSLLYRLEVELIEEAMAAAPALFAKPGDLFCTRDENSYFIGDSCVAYRGRAEVDGPYLNRSPKKGWLHFCNGGYGNHINIWSGGIRDTLGAWPRSKYSHYNPSGVSLDHTLCIPPEMCSHLNLPKEYGDDGNEIPPRDIKERVKETSITDAMLQEAKRAAPVLVAKPGDLFRWIGVVVIYMGRNEVPPISVDIGGTATGPHMVDTPPIGWLVFHNHDDRRVDIDREGGIRDELGARPKEVYSHYDESGKRVAGTLCLPPEKCGVLRVCADPED